MTWTLVIITGLKYFRLWFGPNELLLLVGWVVIFVIRASHQSELCDESRLSLNLDGKASETSLISPRDLRLYVFRLTRTSGESVISYRMKIELSLGV